MKKGFFLLAALSAIYSGKTSSNGIDFEGANNFLKNCNPISKGYAGHPSKHVWKVMDKKRKSRNKLNRISKQSRNINHKKAA